MSVRILLKQKIICSQFLVGDSWFGLHPYQLSPHRNFELIICFFNESILLTDQMFFSQESKQVCHYEMEGPGLPPLHNTGSLSASSVAGSSSGQMPESPSVGAPHMHPHLTSGKNLEIIWSKSHLVMRMIEMRIGQEPLLQVCALWLCKWNILSL